MTSTRSCGVLRAEGGDLPGVEVKSAAGGVPESIVPTLCAFAIRPGGGVIVLGLDEVAGFVPVGLADPRELKAAVASKARRALEPSIIVDLDDAVVDGETGLEPAASPEKRFRGRPANLRKHLRALREQRLITQYGGQGQRTTYTRTP